MALASPFFCPMENHAAEGIASSEIHISLLSCPWSISQSATLENGLAADSSPQGLHQGLAPQHAFEGEAGEGIGQDLEFAGCRAWSRAQEGSRKVGRRRNNSKRWDALPGEEHAWTGDCRMIKARNHFLNEKEELEEHGRKRTKASLASM